MVEALQTVGWIACIIYATIPGFWLVIHPRVEYWRARPRSPYRVLLPVWIAMWLLLAAITSPWRNVVIDHRWWCWIPAAGLFCVGLSLYKFSGSSFSWRQLGGLPEILPHHREQRLVTTGIRARVRHPVYLGHLCEMFAWSLGTGLAVCWALTAFAMVTGAVMIRMEDAELEKRFGEQYREYRTHVPGVVPRIRAWEKA
ncbi:MAG: isoprenylcysteine carboxylmethyltransferase family protein [Candidatus Sulfotelmatobacter sp.]